jgi:hypothetical protein
MCTLAFQKIMPSRYYSIGVGMVLVCGVIMVVMVDG